VFREPYYILSRCFVKRSKLSMTCSVYMNYTELTKKMDNRNFVLKLQTKDTDDSYQ